MLKRKNIFTWSNGVLLIGIVLAFIVGTFRGSSNAKSRFVEDRASWELGVQELNHKYDSIMVSYARYREKYERASDSVEYFTSLLETNKRNYEKTIVILNGRITELDTIGVSGVQKYFDTRYPR